MGGQPDRRLFADYGENILFKVRSSELRLFSTATDHDRRLFGNSPGVHQVPSYGTCRTAFGKESVVAVADGAGSIGRTSGSGMKRYPAREVEIGDGTTVGGGKVEIPSANVPSGNKPSDQTSDET